MPVYKYRRIEDMPDASTYFGDRNIAGRIRFALSTARLAGSLRIPRGVQKFRSFEELAADRERFEEQRIARIRATRAAKQ
ncbi:MAG TPA: hypothetical protein VGF28_14505 [Thermoanaerobaculia bacterium]|jgi:hypothetical protein